MSVVWIWFDYTTQNKAFTLSMLIMTVLAGLLMVSNIRFYSFKEFNLGNRVPFLDILVAVLTLVCIALNPPVLLFVLFLGYALSGPVMTLLTLRQRRKKRIQMHKEHHKS